MKDAVIEPVPVGTPAGFLRYLSSDLRSGFLVFLIALPLCLGISIASGYPPIAGIFTAIIGGVVGSLISNSEMTIKGPAAGLIVIAVGCIQDFGGDGVMGGFSAADMSAYQAALAVGVVAAGLQIAFALFRGGILADFFPLSAVHGMLAAIGVIIILKQFPVTLGVSIGGEPLELIKEIPHAVMEANPEIAAIGIASLLVMFLWPLVGKRIKPLAAVPSPLVVLALAIPMGIGFDLGHEHYYQFAGHEHKVGPNFLVSMPDRIFGMFDDVTSPDFGALAQGKAWKWVFMFFMIGTLESVLSAKAVDLLDPHRRRTNLDRDMLAVGIGNAAAAMVGGLPMISEIVRSRANIDNGAKTRWANLWHGFFLLACVALIPTLLHLIPLAALAAMLVFTGYRLAHPREFMHTFKIGPEQLVIFVTTLVAVLATDLLIGVGIGIGVKVAIHLANGVPLGSLFKPYLDVEMIGDDACVVRAQQSAVFSNWIPFRRQLLDLALVQHRSVTLDLSATRLVDHSTMEKLHELETVIHADGGRLRVTGLDGHRPLSAHEYAARKASAAPFGRIEVIAASEIVESIEDLLSDRELLAVDVVRDGDRARLSFVVPSGRVTELEAELAPTLASDAGATLVVTDVRRVRCGRSVAVTVDV
jgi:MFS superfamily sulfate permease-like transporter